MMFRKFELFTAKKLIRGRKNQGRTRPVVRISVLAISLSCAVMILTAAVVRGFKKEISDKVIGFGAHIQVSHYDSRNSYESRPVRLDEEMKKLRTFENIEQCHPVVVKAGIFKNGEHIQAAVLKGVGIDYNWDFFKNQLKEGSSFPDGDSKKVLLSSVSAKALDATVGDEVFLYFIQDPPRVRKVKVAGIYDSGFTQFDELIAMTDINLLQKINGWDSGQVSGCEIRLRDVSKLEETNDEVYAGIANDLNSMTIFEKHPDIFNWLELQDINFIIIVVLMILVSAINAASALIILILEKGNTIGILKSLGIRNSSLRKIFIAQGIYLLLTGLFWGNLIGTGLSFIQSKFGIVKLPVESYYLSSVPIHLEMMDFLFINVCTILLCFLSLILPSQIISRTEVAKVLKFD